MRVTLTLFLTAALAVPTAALAGNKDKKAHHVSPEQVYVQHVPVALITVTERTIIYDYVHHYRYAFSPPAGVAKPLPPGIAKKIARGGTLPPGIAKRYLPQDLLVQLPPRPGCQCVVVDNDVVLIATATGIVVDALRRPAVGRQLNATPHSGVMSRCLHGAPLVASPCPCAEYRSSSSVVSADGTRAPTTKWAVRVARP